MQLDGRWMLVAQHLAAWRELFLPQFANMLPGLALTLSQLVVAENRMQGV
jgi:hypothetical protein